MASPINDTSRRSIMSNISRRGFLKYSGSAALTAAFSPYFVPTAHSAESVTMGALTPQTGAYSFAGELYTNGAKLALAERNYKILGKNINFIVRDSEAKPAPSVRRLTNMITQHDLQYFGGGYSSAAGLAQSEVAQQQKVVQYAAGGSTEFVGSHCSRYTFQWSANAYPAMKAVVDYMVSHYPGAKSWYLITADYVFGHTISKYIHESAKEAGISIVGEKYAPLGESQFNQYLISAAASDADVLCLLNAGNDAVSAIRQWSGYGKQNVKVIVPWGLSVKLMRGLTPQARSGIIAGENYYHAIDTPVNLKFVRDYRKNFGAYPGYVSGYGYDTFRTMLLAMEQAESTEPAKVVKQLEGMHYDGILGATYIDPEIHQTVRPYYVIEGRGNSTDEGIAELVYEGSANVPESVRRNCKALGSY